MSIDYKILLMAILVVFDIIMTIVCVKFLGAIELNPLCNNFLIFMAYKIMLSIIAICGVIVLKKESYTTHFITIIIVLYAAVGVLNIYQYSMFVL